MSKSRVSSRGSQYHALQRASLVDPESVTLALVQPLDTWPHHWKAWLAGVSRSRRDRRTWPLIGSLPKYFTWISSPGLNPKTRASWTWRRRWHQHFITRVQICVAYICHVHNIVRHNIISDMQHNYDPCSYSYQGDILLPLTFHIDYVNMQHTSNWIFMFNVWLRALSIYVASLATSPANSATLMYVTKIASRRRQHWQCWWYRFCRLNGNCPQITLYVNLIMLHVDIHKLHVNKNIYEEKTKKTQTLKTNYLFFSSIRKIKLCVLLPYFISCQS